VNFVTACNVADLKPGSSLGFAGAGATIAIFNVDGRIFATQDSCPHGQWSLSDSYVSGDTIECALHGGRFSISSGKRLGPPVCRALRTYAVKIEGESVLVDVDSGAYELRPGAVLAAEAGGSSGLG
jgi:biphenyl 2,3-dioxygenase ferredoxin component